MQELYALCFEGQGGTAFSNRLKGALPRGFLRPLGEIPGGAQRAPPGISPRGLRKPLYKASFSHLLSAIWLKMHKVENGVEKKISGRKSKPKKKFLAKNDVRDHIWPKKN